MKLYHLHLHQQIQTREIQTLCINIIKRAVERGFCLEDLRSTISTLDNNRKIHGSNTNLTDRNTRPNQNGIYLRIRERRKLEAMPEKDRPPPAIDAPVSRFNCVESGCSHLFDRTGRCYDCGAIKR